MALVDFPSFRTGRPLGATGKGRSVGSSRRSRSRSRGVFSVEFASFVHTFPEAATLSDLQAALEAASFTAPSAPFDFLASTPTPATVVTTAEFDVGAPI
ncbi:hypothetical protein IV203_023269 [Nitzschia inconspicua]|uniref:Uncharacterized protein n=1 Tax=Nitzschia inconspicua TaxID=303405 RepID=A0A9K3KCY2_9STRA|nr:hypothetical protein IV203_023269 [Nitzschia inconspicua]